jgi:hypothetical protein
LHPIFITREIIVSDIRIHAGVCSERPLPAGGAVTSNIFMWFSVNKENKKDVTLSVSTQAVP